MVALARSISASASIVLLVVFGPLAPSAADAENLAVSAPQGQAIAGYDPVAYFREGRAVQGGSDHVLRWRGALWHFASAEALEAFEMNPAAFAPQFGGFCAYSLASGTLRAGDPQVFVILGGRLFLIGSEPARREWERDIVGNISRAAAYWPVVAGQ